MVRDVLAEGRFLIDGPPHWRERALIVVPSASAPPREQIVAFDYANNPAPAPLHMLDAPRPANVAHVFASFPNANAYAKSAGAPNAAVQALRGAVRAIYRDEAERAQAQASATQDPRVVGITAQAYFGTRTWPERPRAGEPFALWHTSSLCSAVHPLHYDEREVTVMERLVRVTVPSRPGPGVGVCPGGESHSLLNVPGLPAGDYRLRLESTSEPDGPYLEGEATFTVLPAGSASATSTRSIPAGGAMTTLLMVLGVLAAAGRWTGTRSPASGTPRE